VRLDDQSRQLLGRARIGMLAIQSSDLPLVNPAAFSYSADSVWMTTSRYAAKLGLARRDPRAAFLVESHGRSVLLQGVLEAYDLRSLSGGVRALLEGPRFGLSMAGYAVKNAAFIGGYLVDLAGVPRQWWPHNRVVLRLRPSRVRGTVTVEPEAAARAPVPGVPRPVATALARELTGYVCWVARGAPGPQMAPGLWAIGDGSLYCWLPEGLPEPPEAAPSAVVVEYHHPFRATRMVGACSRGRLVSDQAALEAIADRYGLEPEGGTPLRLEVNRVTWWRGFEVRTTKTVSGVPC